MSEYTEQTLTDLQNDWLETIKRCEASGQTMKAFAASEDLALKDLYAWKKTLVKKGVLPRTRAPRFEKMKIVDTVPTKHECRIQLPNGVTVILSGPLDNLSMTDLLHSAMQV